MAKMTAQPMSDREVRVIGDDLRLEKRAEDDDKRRIRGYAAVFDSPTDIAGMFREQVAPGAFAAAISRDDVRALVDHDPSRILGRNRAGTLKLSEDERGLMVEIDPPDTQAARDIIVSLERGDVTGMSFAFRATKQEWDDTQDPPLRTIREAELFDVSVVTYPAYADTSVAVRSLEEHRSAKAAEQAEEQPSRSRLLRRLRMKAELDRLNRRVAKVS